MQKEYDLIIIGGGLVGGSLLLALKSLNLKIAIIDAKSHHAVNLPSSNNLDQRSLVLNLGSKLYYESLGIWDKIKPFTVEIKKIVVSEQGRFNKIFLDNKNLKVPALGYVINIDLLNQVIWDSINSDLERSEYNANYNYNSKIDIYSPCTVQDLMIEQDAIKVVLNNGCLLGKMIVGADGVKSTVRSLVNIAVDYDDYEQFALIANVSHEKENSGVAYERFSEQGPFALLPRKNENNNYFSGIVWPWPNNEINTVKNWPDNVFLKELQNLFGFKLGEFLKIGERQLFPLARICARELYKDRIILLGNAANSIHPIGGQGFNLGLRDVKCFSTLLAENLDRIIQNKYDSNYIQDIYKKYAFARYNDHYRLKNNTHQLLGLYSSNKVLMKTARNIGAGILNRSYILKNIIADQNMGLLV